MITGMMALLLLQAQPLLRPVPQQTAMAALHLRRQRMLADGHALLNRAEVASRGYNPPPATKAELDAEIDQMKDQLDSMSEMGEMESLRLQMAMDRMSKLMTTLSNMLKKISDTSAGITQNMK